MTTDMVSARFHLKVDKRAGCWIWTGMRNGRHGQFSVQRRPKNVRVPAHAFAWRDAGRDLPDGATMIQACGTDLCVRPDHWRVGERAELPAYADDKAATRFWAKVRRVDGDGCWEWQGARQSGGYGYMSRRGKYRLAHRLAWAYTNGRIPEGRFVCHRCDNPPCVRPDHLFLGAPSDNSADMVEKGRAHRPIGLTHYAARFTAEQVREIRRRYEEGGVTMHALGQEYDVAVMTIQRLVARKSYQDVV